MTTRDSFKKFTAEEDEALIAFVEKNQCLFNRKHENYKNNQIKNLLWKEASELTNRSVNDCKLRWKNLRDYRNRSKNKRTGTDLLKRLNFLKGTEHRRNKRTWNVPAVAKQEISNSSQINDVGENVESQSYPHVDVILDTPEDENFSEISEWSSTERKQQSRLEFAITPVDDDLTKFFQCMEATTRNLPKPWQIKIKRGISALVYDAEDANENERTSHKTKQIT